MSGMPHADGPRQRRTRRYHGPTPDDECTTESSTERCWVSVPPGTRLCHAGKKVAWWPAGPSEVSLAPESPGLSSQTPNAASFRRSWRYPRTFASRVFWLPGVAFAVSILIESKIGGVLERAYIYLYSAQRIRVGRSSGRRRRFCRLAVREAWVSSMGGCWALRGSAQC